MTTKSHIGLSFYFSAGLPATNDDDGFEAKTWTKVPGYQGGVRFGFEAEGIDVPNLETGITTKLKGMSSGAASTATFHGVSTETGAAALKVLADGLGGVGCVKIVRATTPGSARIFSISNPVMRPCATGDSPRAACSVPASSGRSSM